MRDRVKDFQHNRRMLKKNSGCYIATAVYGSYDCPQVWTLRRYRDNKLAQSWQGRVFIKFYYFFSPKMVQLFGKTKWFNYLGRKQLDVFVGKLNRQGVDDKPYNDAI